MNNEKFYNSLSSLYDEMINFDDALTRRKKLLSNFVADHKTASDLGCGTGVDSISLAMLGLKVDAFDQSEDMINKAANNARKYGTDINFIAASIDGSSTFASNNYDLVISLGNTLANLNENQLTSAIKNIIPLINDGGKIILQILNYAVVKDKIHTINEKENDKLKITRYYEKGDNSLQFKIKISQKQEGKEETISTEIYPHTLKTFENIFGQTGISPLFYGDLNLNEFNENSSKDLVVIAEK